jgi:hypothetical protein
MRGGKRTSTLVVKRALTVTQSREAKEAYVHVEHVFMPTAER